MFISGSAPHPVRVISITPRIPLWFGFGLHVYGYVVMPEHPPLNSRSLHFTDHHFVMTCSGRDDRIGESMLFIPRGLASRTPSCGNAKINSLPS